MDLVVFLVPGGANSLRELREKNGVMCVNGIYMRSSEWDSLMRMRRNGRRRSPGLGPGCVVVTVRRRDIGGGLIAVTNGPDLDPHDVWEPGERAVIVDKDLLHSRTVEDLMERVDKDLLPFETVERWRKGTMYTVKLDSEDLRLQRSVLWRWRFLDEMDIAVFLVPGGASSLRELREKNGVMCVNSIYMRSSEWDSLMRMRRNGRRRSPGLGPGCVVVTVTGRNIGRGLIAVTNGPDLDPSDLWFSGERAVIVDKDLLPSRTLEDLMERVDKDLLPLETVVRWMEGADEGLRPSRTVEAWIKRMDPESGRGGSDVESKTLSAVIHHTVDGEYGQGGSDAESTTESTLSASTDVTSDMHCCICYELPSESAWECDKCLGFVCMSCLERTWANPMGDRITKPDCPMCRKPVSDADIARVLGERGLKRVQYFRNVRKFAGCNEVILCASEDCRAPVFCEGSALVGLQVPIACDCGAETCGQCGQLWHPDSECPKPKRGWGLRRSQLWMFTHTKRCPQCGASIQKIDGCSHVECENCGLSFCWTCKGVRELETVGEGFVGHRRRCICGGLQLKHLIIVPVGLLVVTVLVGGYVVIFVIAMPVEGISYASQTAGKVMVSIAASARRRRRRRAREARSRRAGAISSSDSDVGAMANCSSPLRCPQCGASIQTINGCSHVECENCGLSFCWKARKGVLGLETVGEPLVAHRLYFNE